MVRWNPNTPRMRMGSPGTSRPAPSGAGWQSWKESWEGRMLRSRSGSTTWRSFASSSPSRPWPWRSWPRSCRASASSWTSCRTWCACREGACPAPPRAQCPLRLSGRPRGWSPSTAGGERRLECPQSRPPEPMTSTDPPNFPLRKHESERTPGKTFWLLWRSHDEMLECYLLSLLSGQECMNLFRFWIEGLRKCFVLRQSPLNQDCSWKQNLCYTWTLIHDLYNRGAEPTKVTSLILKTLREWKGSFRKSTLLSSYRSGLNGVHKSHIIKNMYSKSHFLAL